MKALMSSMVVGHRQEHQCRKGQPWIPFEQGVEVVAGGQHAPHVLDRQTTAADHRLAAETLGVDRDSLQQFVFVHGSPR